MIIISSQGHMTSTKNLKELHRFAKRLGLKKEMFVPASDHITFGFYSVNSPKKRKEAIKSGAKLAGGEEFVLSLFTTPKLENMNR
ncbi:MAG: DUF4031 domain-containing protein [Desulfobacteraceae bacterium]|nr:MAG: DUF4031 domain-containing protein [Desulfobacteraceae bacterium]